MATETEAQMLRCDTCGKPSSTVSRVVVDSGYNRANARAIYNCPDCYQKKLEERQSQPAGAASGTQ